MRALVVVAMIFASSRSYAGAWYYKWSCSGKCAPNQLAISGVSAGYPTQEMCEQDRWNDPRRTEFVAEGNLGGLTSCEEYKDPPAPDANAGSQQPSRPVVLQRFGLGISSGTGYRVRDASTLAVGGKTLGLDLNFVAGPRPWIGLEMGFGIQFTSVLAPHYGPDEKTLTYAPITLGFTSSPGLVHGNKIDVRLDLGLDLVGLFQLGCDTCEADNLDTVALLGELRGGIDFYFGKQKGMGISIGATMMLGQQGNMSDEFLPSAVEILPPRYLLRAAYIGRNTNLIW